MVKQEAIDCINSLPDTVEWNDILYSLYVIQKIQKGRQEAADGNGVPIEKARESFGIL